ncbi:MAG: hypothetical protein SFV22_12455 [Saprospiraceae bacterium]|nr:hypothetical protein [Saprospiraceae bacterium]
MQYQSSYRRIGAGALMLLFTALWSLKTTHGWLLHTHSHEAHPVCSAAYDHHSAHIHDESWAKEDCTLCAFVVSIPEPFSLPEWPFLQHQPPQCGPGPIYTAPFVSKSVCDAALRRGPPVCGDSQSVSVPV